MNYIKLLLLAFVAFVAALGTNWGIDAAYKTHAFIIMLIAIGMFILVLRNIDEISKLPQTKANISIALSVPA